MKKIIAVFISLLFWGYCANVYATDSDDAKKMLLYQIGRAHV